MNDQAGWKSRYSREIVAAGLVVGLAVLFRTLSGGQGAVAEPPGTASAAVAPPGLRPVALVNGAEISADELSNECLARHGVAVLEALVNRKIIEQACQAAGITITRQHVDAEIDTLAKRFSVPRDKWLELIEKERGIAAKQYSEDILWPMLALRALARGTNEPTEAEIREAFEKQYGPAVKARIIATRTRNEAERLRAQAVAAPDEFGSLARQHSVDVGSASANGWVQPIRLHSGEPAFDRAAFALEPGNISDVVQVGDQFILIKCEGRFMAHTFSEDKGETMETVQRRLAEEIRERKSRGAASDVFKSLQEKSTVENVLNDPKKSAAQPGVAALVNGQPIMVDEVRRVALERHGRDVIEILITRTLIRQALEKQHFTIAQADLDAEITRAALSLGFKKADGSPDVTAWLDRMTREEKVPIKHYMEDIVWPTVALKKLTGGVPVLQDDLDKAFAATFGPRAKCRIIVLESQRKAQEVWQLARQATTPEAFGKLAETYSVDPTTRALQGEVPPIQRFGGQPTLEKEVFALKPGELSSIVNIADRHMVILCEGFTEPAKVSFEEVRDELFDDIFEKKQRIEMARHFTHLRESATIDNFLAGTSQTPNAKVAKGTASPTPGGLSKVDAEELRQPRAGSRLATPGVVPATHAAPAGK